MFLQREGKVLPWYRGLDVLVDHLVVGHPDAAFKPSTSHPTRKTAWIIVITLVIALSVLDVTKFRAFFDASQLMSFVFERSSVEYQRFMSGEVDEKTVFQALRARGDVSIAGDPAERWLTLLRMSEIEIRTKCLSESKNQTTRRIQVAEKMFPKRPEQQFLMGHYLFTNDRPCDAIPYFVRAIQRIQSLQSNSGKILFFPLRVVSYCRSLLELGRSLAQCPTTTDGDAVEFVLQSMYGPREDGCWREAEPHAFDYLSKVLKASKKRIKESDVSSSSVSPHSTSHGSEFKGSAVVIESVGDAEQVLSFVGSSQDLRQHTETKENLVFRAQKWNAFVREHQTIVRKHARQVVDAHAFCDEANNSPIFVCNNLGESLAQSSSSHFVSIDLWSPLLMIVERIDEDLREFWDIDSGARSLLMKEVQGILCNDLKTVKSFLSLHEISLQYLLGEENHALWMKWEKLTDDLFASVRGGACAG
jgi:hypothetical protein